MAGQTHSPPHVGQLSHKILEAMAEDNPDAFQQHVGHAFGDKRAMRKVLDGLIECKAVNCTRVFHVQHYIQVVRIFWIDEAETFLKAARLLPNSEEELDEVSDTDSCYSSDDGESHPAYKKN